MKTLLMVESWCYASGVLLPLKIRELGHRFIFLARKPSFYADYAPEGERQHPVLALADEVVTCDTNDIGALIDATKPLLQRCPIDGVITSCDYYLKAVSELASAFGLPSSPVSALSASLNKYLMRVIHKEKGLSGPRFALALSVNDALRTAEEVGFPAIVKPADMNGSTLVQKVGNIAQLKDAISAINAIPENTRGQMRFPGALTEEYLEGEEFSVECYAYRGDLRTLGVTDKKLGGRDGVVETGHMFPARLPQTARESVEKQALDSLKAIGYTDGVAHVEIRLTSDGPRVIEINPRIGGNYISELVERVTGVSPLVQMIQIALGEEPVRPEKDFKTKSAAVAFVLPRNAGVLSGFEGGEGLARAQGVARCVLSPSGSKVASPDDNNCYLGYVITEDKEGLGAGDAASRALENLRPVVV